MRTLFRLIALWLPLGIVLTALSILVYGAVQQNYRQSLNDPQIQMAEDAAARLAGGAPQDEIVPLQAVDISTSLSPWIEVYTDAGVPVASSGKLNGALPRVPLGALDSAVSGRGKDTPAPNEDRITWQPQRGLRQAVVIVYFSSQNGSGFVVAGRNMREVEAREQRLGAAVFLAWLGAAAASFVAVALARIFV